MGNKYGSTISYQDRWTPFTEKLRRLMKENPSLAIFFEGCVEADCEVVEICDPFTEEIVGKGIRIKVTPIEDRQVIDEEVLPEYMVELENLKVVKRKEIAYRIRAARAKGNLSENEEYDAAKTEQRVIEARIDELEKIIKNAMRTKSINNWDELND